MVSQTGLTAAGSLARDAGRFRVGRVLGRSFGIFFRRVIRFFVLAAIPASIPSLLQVELIASMAPLPLLDRTPLFPVLIALARASLLPEAARVALLMAVGLLVALAAAIILEAAVEDARRRRFRLGRSLRRALVRLIPMLGVVAIVMVLVAATSVLVVVPLMLGTMFAVAVPVCVVESIGPLASLKRSVALTRGHRWKIFGMIILLGFTGFFTVVFSTVPNIVLAVSLGFRSVTGNTVAVAMVIEFVCYTLLVAYLLIVVAVVYHDLRVAHDGLDSEQMAEVFG